MREYLRRQLDNMKWPQLMIFEEKQLCQLLPVQGQRGSWTGLPQSSQGALGP